MRKEPPIHAYPSRSLWFSWSISLRSQTLTVTVDTVHARLKDGFSSDSSSRNLSTSTFKSYEPQILPIPHRVQRNMGFVVREQSKESVLTPHYLRSPRVWGPMRGFIGLIFFWQGDEDCEECGLYTQKVWFVKRLRVNYGRPVGCEIKLRLCWVSITSWCLIPGQDVLTGTKSTVSVHHPRSHGCEDRLNRYLTPKGIGEKSKQLNDITQTTVSWVHL